jgi:hypothetical protein
MSLDRSYSPVVLADSWLAVCCAISNSPSLHRYSVMPVARRLWQPMRVAIPAASARRQIIRYTSACDIGRSDNAPCGPKLRRKGEEPRAIREAS